MAERWSVHLGELGLSARAQRTLADAGAQKAWHAAILCRRCLEYTRNCGKKTLVEIAGALTDHGFPAQRLDCYDRRYRQPSGCQRELAACRAMLERGEWS